MKKFKKTALIVLILSVLSALAVALAACGQKADSIAVKETPRLSYVQGQELDLSRGVLTATEGEKTWEVALSASGVKVSGYDKNQLGEQTLTVEYGGKTCTFKVTVHGRVEAVDYDADYLVGERFNREKGKLLLYRDDGVASSSVRLNDAAVSMESAPFAAAGSSTLTATYQGNAAEIKVNVYKAENKRLYSPNTLEYKSHDAKLDLSGGYLVITANGGKLTRRVALTESMVSGFNPAAATAENIATPLKQKLTVSYLGEEYSFDVGIRYSYVSLMRLRAGELANADLANLTEAQGKNAIEALNGYFGLTPADKALLTAEEKTAVVRAATVYGKKTWNDVFGACSGSVTVDDKGKVAFLGGNYAKAHEDYTTLSGQYTSLTALADSLGNIVKEFANETIADGKTAKDYIGTVLDARSLGEILNEFEYMFDLYEKYGAIPADWTQDKEAVKSAIQTVASSSYRAASYANLYEVVSSWCNVDNVFDTFYDYCYAEKDADLLKEMGSVCPPQAFEELHGNVRVAIDCVRAMADYSVLDTTDFFLLYDRIVADSEALASSTDAQTKWLYENMYFDFGSNSLPFYGWIMYLQIADYGYYFHCHGALGDEQFNGIWSAYVSIMEGIYENDTYEGADVEAMFRSFVEAPPSLQYAFIASVNPYYNYFPHYNAIPEHALDYSNALFSTNFTDLVFGYYVGEGSTLSTSGRVIFSDLMIALEDYSLRLYGGEKGDTKIDYLDQFLKKMATAEAKYATLTGDEKTAFDGKVGFFYDKYLAIYQMYNADGSQKAIALGEWQDEFTQLADVVNKVSVGYDLISGGILAYGTLVSGYEYAQTLADNILKNAPADVVNAYYYGNYVNGMSLESALYMLRESYANALTEGNLWEEYRTATDLQAFMATASPVMQMQVDYMYAYATDDQAGVAAAFGAANKQAVIAALNAFYPLSAEDKLLFYNIDYTQTNYSSSLFMYDAALNGYFEENLGSKAYAAALALLDWEYLYTAYVNNDGAAEDLAKLNTAVEKFNGLYTALDNELAEFNEYFSGMYSYYKTAYDAIEQA